MDHGGAIVLPVVRWLTLRTWFLSVWPWLVRRRLSGSVSLARCYVVDRSRVALAVAHVTGRLVGVAVEPLRFRMMDIRDAQGLLIQWRIADLDLPQVQTAIMAEPVFREALRAGADASRLTMYLAKTLIPMSVTDRDALSRILLVIQVCAWQAAHGAPSGTVPVLFLERRPWFAVLARYASQYGVTLMATPPRFNVRARVRQSLGPAFRMWLRRVRDQWGLREWRWTRGASPASPARRNALPEHVRIAVDYYGQFNLTEPACYSDLFFWQQSSIPGRHLVLCFAQPHYPLDEDKRRQLTACGIEPVVLHGRATTLPESSGVCYGPRRLWRERIPRLRLQHPRTPEAVWLKEQHVTYYMVRRFWETFFSAARVKVYVTWFKYDGTHCAVADALEEIGGVLAVYQRAYESHASIRTAVDTDLMFGFSKPREAERTSGSRIRYRITTGYLGDHRFPLLREHAVRVREGLARHGATRVLGFADEHTMADARWFQGHEFTQQNYAFLLEKVLEERWLGLVIKPKVPSTLRQRLGPVADLLQRAEATGRCFVYETGHLRSAYPPAAAALAADVMVHGNLHAATAGVESALAGVPTLLVDREGWAVSPLCQLGVGRVVFTDWEHLWQACVDHWRYPGGVPGIGDWSSMLEELDPFRDGRAAQRMGTYLHWLLEGFAAGLRRETVMADAAQRYAARWGTDKIAQIGTDRQGPPAAQDTCEDVAQVPAGV